MTTSISKSIVVLCLFLQCTGPAEISTFPVPNCSALPEGRPKNVLCVLKNETLYNGSDATRDTDILMDSSKLDAIISNLSLIQVKNYGLTIANGQVVVNKQHADTFRDRWEIKINGSVDPVESGTPLHILKHRITVKNLEYIDESLFSLSITIGINESSTSNVRWFNKSQQGTVPPTSPPSDPTPSQTTTDSPKTTPEPERGCVSTQKFDQAMSYVNQNLMKLNEHVEQQKQTTTSSLGGWNLALLVLGLIFLIFDSRLMNKYIYPKIKSLYAHYSEIQQEDPGSSNGPAIPNSNQPSQESIEMEHVLASSPLRSSQENLQVFDTHVAPVDESPD